MSELNILIRWVITSGIFYAFELTISKFKWIAQFNCCLVIRRHTEKGLQKSKEKIKDNSEFVRESCYRQLQWWVKYISWKEKTVKAFFFLLFLKACHLDRPCVGNSVKGTFSTLASYFSVRHSFIYIFR